MTIHNTPRLSLPYPDSAETADVPRDVQALAAPLDQAVLYTEGALAARPAASLAGRIYRATDTGQIFVDFAASWFEIANAAPAAQFATGDLKATALAAAPSGWLMCDGALYDTSAYPALYAGIGRAYSDVGAIPDPGTKFRVPDLRNRVPVGVSGSKPRGFNGGEETHTLLQSEMPSHSHPLTVPFVNYASPAPAGVPFDLVGGSGGARATFSAPNVAEGAVGGGGAHNNMQPYVAVNWMVKT